MKESMRRVNAKPMAKSSSVGRMPMTPTSLAKPKRMAPAESVRSIIGAPFMSVAQPETQMVYIKD